VDLAIVVRFSQELGDSGFRELSRAIKNYINLRLALRYGEQESPGEGLAGEIRQGVDDAGNRTLDKRVGAEKIIGIVHLMRAT